LPRISIFLVLVQNFYTFFNWTIGKSPNKIISRETWFHVWNELGNVLPLHGVHLYFTGLHFLCFPLTYFSISGLISKGRCFPSGNNDNVIMVTFEGLAFLKHFTTNLQNILNSEISENTYFWNLENCVSRSNLGFGGTSV